MTTQTARTFTRIPYRTFGRPDQTLHVTCSTKGDVATAMRRLKARRSTTDVTWIGSPFSCIQITNADGSHTYEAR